MMSVGAVSAVASQRCHWCHGYGFIPTRKPHSRTVILCSTVMRVCGCVERAIFRECLAAYKQQSQLIEAGGPSLSLTPGAIYTWGYRAVEYCADFTTLAERELDAGELRLFRRHMVDGEPWDHFAAPADKKKFFFGCYGIMERLGGIYAEQGLYPASRYFSGHTVRRSMVAINQSTLAGIKQALRTFPLPRREGYYKARKAARAALVGAAAA